MMQSIQRQDIDQKISSHQGGNILKSALDESNQATIYPLLTKYVLFNRSFGAGVAYLSSQLATQPDLFKDSAEEPLWNDRSMEVAARVFSAAVDEFGDRDVASHPTHRMLAQATLKGLIKSGYDPSAMASTISSFDKSIDTRVKAGYGMSHPPCEQELFRALGFHIGSELLADEEFKIIDATLRERYAQLVTTLNANVTISDTSVPAYHWIKIHTSVEMDHFAHAIKGANMALHYYAGKQSKDFVKRQILDGIASFANLHEEIMLSLKGGSMTEF